MTIAECGFRPTDEKSSPALLIEKGPTLYVEVSSYDGKGNILSNLPSSTQTPALIDTGARCSCIDDALAQRLALPIVDRREISGISGKHMADVYMAHISSPHLRCSEYGFFTGVALKAGGQIHEVLIGRSFLQDKIMIYDGVRGQVTILV